MRCADCQGHGSYGYVRSLELRGIEYQGESVPDILLICQPCKGTGERPELDEEVRRVAGAMREVAGERGVDFMTSPLSDIVAALEAAQERLDGS